ncbi:MAG: hypothetical protein MI922_20090, partial [Bacteroidales bacterium]|nr:hypothetical protein [Bacteroidales bacterium]
MKKTLLLLFSTLLCIIAFSQDAINFPNGRIAISSDGNIHDEDDWGATAMSLAIIDAANLNSKLVHYSFSDHLGASTAEGEKQM